MKTILAKMTSVVKRVRNMINFLSGRETVVVVVGDR